MPDLVDGLRIQPHPSDELVAAVFLRAVSDGDVDVVWHNGRPGLREVLDWNRSQDCILFGCLLSTSGNEKLDIAGLGWANKISSVGDRRRAEVGMYFLRPYQNGYIPFRFAVQMLDWGFENLKIDIFFGTIPTPNKQAIKFSTRLGFREIAVLPWWEAWNGQAVDSYLCAVTRAEWDQIKDRQEEFQTVGV